MTIQQIIQKLNDLGFNQQTKKILVGLNIYSTFKKELGNVANRFQSVFFELDSSLSDNEIVLL